MYGDTLFVMTESGPTTSIEVKNDLLTRQECIDALTSVKQHVCSLFPFRTVQERENFVADIDRTLGAEELSMPVSVLVEKIRVVLSSLKNSHTKLRISGMSTSEEEQDMERLKPEALLQSEMLPNNIGYLKIDAWSSKKNDDGKDVGDLAEEALQRLRGAKAIIIDVRDNGGGDSSIASKVAGHFLNTETPFARILIRRGPTDLALDESVARVEPRAPFIDLPLVVLIGPKCLSSNEMFILILKDTGRATAIGQKTHGGSGNPQVSPLTLGAKKYELLVSTWLLKRMDGQELEGVGIRPDIAIETTPGVDAEGGADVVLDKAKEHINAIPQGVAEM